MEGLRMPELLVILAVALLLFGGRVANLGGSLGQAIRNFKKGLNGDDSAPTPSPAAAPEQPGQPNAALAAANAIETQVGEAAPAVQKS